MNWIFCLSRLLFTLISVCASFCRSSLPNMYASKSVVSASMWAKVCNNRDQLPFQADLCEKEIGKIVILIQHHVNFQKGGVRVRVLSYTHLSAVCVFLLLLYHTLCFLIMLFSLLCLATSLNFVNLAMLFVPAAFF